MSRAFPEREDCADVPNNTAIIIVDLAFNVNETVPDPARIGTHFVPPPAVTPSSAGGGGDECCTQPVYGYVDCSTFDPITFECDPDFTSGGSDYYKIITEPISATWVCGGGTASITPKPQHVWEGRTECDGSTCNGEALGESVALTLDPDGGVLCGDTPLDRTGISPMHMNPGTPPVRYEFVQVNFADCGGEHPTFESDCAFTDERWIGWGSFDFESADSLEIDGESETLILNTVTVTVGIDQEVISGRQVLSEISSAAAGELSSVPIEECNFE